MPRFLDTQHTPGGRYGLGLVDGPPVAGYVTSLFGVRDSAHPRAHTGVDIGAPTGTPVLAPAAGVVTDAFHLSIRSGAWAAWKSVYGNSVILRHDDGTYSLYAHLSAVAAREGQRVELGQRIGDVGSTGQSTGPHLHWAMAAADNRYFQRDDGGGLSRFLDPLALVGPAPVPEPAPAPPAAGGTVTAARFAAVRGHLAESRRHFERGLTELTNAERAAGGEG